MAHAIAKYSTSPVLNSSMLKNTEAMGQFTAPQNTATKPMAAPKPAGSPMAPPSTQPKHAPTKKEGTTSPPLNPNPMVTAVNSSFQSHAHGSTSPLTARSTISIPAPL